MQQTGGGLITNNRTKEPTSTLPQAGPVKQAGQAIQRQQAQGGLVQPQAQPAPQPAPQAPAPAPQGGMAATPAPQPQGMAPGAPQGMPGEQPINDVANNALTLLHDPEAFKQFETMIGQGPQGAAQAAALIYEQVYTAHEQHGSPVDDTNAGEAAEAIISDITDIGLAMGSFPAEPVIDGIPASAMEFVARTGEILAPKFPAIAAEFQAIASEGATPEDDATAQQIGQFMGGGNVNAG